MFGPEKPVIFAEAKNVCDHRMYFPVFKKSEAVFARPLQMYMSVAPKITASTLKLLKRLTKVKLLNNPPPPKYEVLMLCEKKDKETCEFEADKISFASLSFHMGLLLTPPILWILVTSSLELPVVSCPCITEASDPS